MKELLSADLVLNKIKHWCAYQERSQFETRAKLRTMRVGADDAEKIIADLITENYLNEERFATALAGGKFRMKMWGRKKIEVELKRHRISEYCIRKAIQSIDEDDYLKTIEKMIDKTMVRKPGEDEQKLFYSVLRYMMSRGFEQELVAEKLSQKLKIN